MSKLRLWGHPRSINVVKVLWALDSVIGLRCRLGAQLYCRHDS
jgi:hypothetical protein